MQVEVHTLHQMFFYSYRKNPFLFSLIEKLKLANGIYTWLQADLLKMKKI